MNSPYSIIPTDNYGKKRLTRKNTKHKNKNRSLKQYNPKPATITVFFDELDAPTKSYSKTGRQHWTYPTKIFPKGWKWNGEDKSSGIYAITHKLLTLAFSTTRKRQRVYSYKHIFTGPISSRQEMKNNLRTIFEHLKDTSRLIIRFKISYT
jgi:hypothetical protein